jgi:hypothetical protein
VAGALQSARPRSYLSWPRPVPAFGTTSISKGTARPSSPKPARWGLKVSCRSRDPNKQDSATAHVRLVARSADWRKLAVGVIHAVGKAHMPCTPVVIWQGTNDDRHAGLHAYTPRATGAISCGVRRREK